MTLISKVILFDTNVRVTKQLNANFFRDQQGYDSNNYCHELESSVAEYFKVKFVRSPCSKEIKVIPIVLKVIRMSTMY